ncbi:MAG: superinfection immunity protein [Acidimicrobiia bacterium]
MSNAVDVAILVVAVGALLIAYFMPTIVAARRDHHQFGAISVVNFLLGWTFIGWAVAMAMAASAVRTQDA